MAKKEVAIGAGAIIVTILAILFFWKKAVAEIADIRVENLVITGPIIFRPHEFDVGNVVTITVSVTNYGTATGSRTIICTVGGFEAQQQMVTLLPNEQAFISFEITPTIAGTYQVSVDGLSGSFVCNEV